MKPVHRQLLALLLAVVLGSALCLSLYVWDNKYTRPGAQPMDGLLTLTDEELEQTDLHFLIHGWAFYPGVLLTPEEWTAHGTEHYMIYTSIGERTRFDQPDGVTPHGYGTYVLTLELPEDPAQYGLELPEIYSAYRLYLNGNLELQVGEPDLEHYQPRTQNRMVTFTGSGFTTILLAVRDDSHFYSGLVYPPALGTPLAVNLSRGLRLGLAVCVTLCGVLGAALAAYFGVRMRHKNALLFALLCLAGSLFTAYPILHSAAAQRQEIRADLALTIPAGVPLGDVEWCTVLGNLLENALEACQRQSRGERRLSLTSWATEGTLFLLVENTYDGWFDRSEGHILSRKAGGVRCGIGLSSVRETVERHGGTMDLYPGEDVFQVGITLPIHNR